MICAPALSAMSAVVRLDHGQPPVGVDRDMSLATDDLLGRVVAALSGRWRLHRLAVDHACRRASRAARPLAVDHQRNVMNGAEQKLPHETAEPPIHRLPRRKVSRQHPPAAARARHVADRVQDFTQVHRGLATFLRRSRQQRRDPLPLLISQIGRVSLRLLRNIGHPATIRWGPHPKLESRHDPRHNPFSNGL